MVLNRVSTAIGSFLYCLTMLGGLTWFILANIYVFNDEGKACSFEQYKATLDYELDWQREWVFQRRSLLAIWAFTGMLTAVLCGYGCIRVIRARYDPEYKPRSMSFLYEHSD